jgi:hypothetical protein
MGGVELTGCDNLRTAKVAFTRAADLESESHLAACLDRERPGIDLQFYTKRFGVRSIRRSLRRVHASGVALLRRFASGDAREHNRPAEAVLRKSALRFTGTEQTWYDFAFEVEHLGLRVGAQTTE